MDRTSTRRLVFLAQVGISAAVILLLLLDADPAQVMDALTGVSWGWLLAAVAAKFGCQIMHEVRLWYALLTGARPRLCPVVAVGLVGGLLNVVLPLRAGDAATAALLVREVRVPTAVAVAAVALVSGLEALAFGVFVIVLLLVEGPRWAQAWGPDRGQDALGIVTVLTLAGIALAVAVTLVGRRVSRPPPAIPGAPGPPVREPEAPHPWLFQLNLLLGYAGDTLGRARYLLGNVGLAYVHLAATLGAYTLLVHALGLQVDRPLLAASVYVMVGAFASVILPPSLGAGPASAAVFSLYLFGVGEARALAFAALAWAIATVPSLLLGFPPLWSRLGRMGTAGAAGFFGQAQRVE